MKRALSLLPNSAEHQRTLAARSSSTPPEKAFRVNSSSNFWVGPSGSWHTPELWSAGHVPEADDAALLDGAENVAVVLPPAAVSADRHGGGGSGAGARGLVDRPLRDRLQPEYLTRARSNCRC